MRTATLRGLRNNFPKLEAWLAEGETVEIRRRGKPVALLTVPSAPLSRTLPPLPDFRARLQEIWGERFFSEEEVARMKAYELESQQG